MATLYAVLLTGNNNWSATTTWSTTANGLGVPAGPPDPTTDVAISSICQAGATLTIDTTASCLNLNWTAVANTPDLAGAVDFRIYGNLTFVTGMTVSYIGQIAFCATSGSLTITTAGKTWPNTGIGRTASTAIWTLQDDFTNTSSFDLNYGTLVTNNKTLTCTNFRILGSGTCALTLGSSVINCTAWNYSGSNFTLTPGSAIINCSGNFTGGGLTTYPIVNLTGATSTMTGNNKMQLGLQPTATQTITATGTIQTVDILTRTGSGLITFVGGTYVKSGGGRLQKLTGSKYSFRQFRTLMRPSFLYK